MNVIQSPSLMENRTFPTKDHPSCNICPAEIKRDDAYRKLKISLTDKLTTKTSISFTKINKSTGLVLLCVMKKELSGGKKKKYQMW